MNVYFYLSVLPEALIASMYDPHKFGRYLATGVKRLDNGPAIFFELNPNAVMKAFDIAKPEDVCQPHEYGEPRKSSYLGIYRVLERTPLSALKVLHLTTRKGITLSLQGTDELPALDDKYYLYQELCPVSPRAVSSLAPEAFADYITDPSNPIGLPKLVFAHLNLGGLAMEPASAGTDDIPYSNVEHIRGCLLELAARPQKKAKVVNRDTVLQDVYPSLASGFYVGDGQQVIAFPMPDADTLSKDHNAWVRSAKAWGRIQ